jgi:hypothetical protein
VLVSVAAVVQSAREFMVWGIGEYYEEDSFHALPISFAGHTFDVRDDQPRDTSYSEEESDGSVQWVRDGKPLAPPSYARVRRGRSDTGRYHLWLGASTFRERASGNTSLWLTRRLQSKDGERPLFEVITVEHDGGMRIQYLHSWQLGRSFPLFRSTQFVRSARATTFPAATIEGFAVSPFPLSMLEGIAIWPILLVFPIGSLVLALHLLRGHHRRPDPGNG